MSLSEYVDQAIIQLRENEQELLQLIEALRETEYSFLIPTHEANLDRLRKAIIDLCKK